MILAFGIGASASIFSLVDAYFLRPPPGVSDPDRLVDLRATRGEKRVGAMTYPDFADLRDRNHVFSGLMAYRATVLDVGRGSETRRVQAALVSSNYFAVLGAGMARGRAFLPEEERHPQGEPVAVISDRLWRGLFDANPDPVGKPVTLNGRRFTVVGVASAGFRGHTTDEAFDIWVPLAMFAVADPGSLASIDSRVWRWLTVVGRLAPGVDLAQAQAEMTVLARQVGELGRRERRPLGVSLEPTRPSLLADTYVWLLIASVGALFLIACANVSNLFLARASARRREVATCLALGAPRRRVVQQFMTESVVLGLLGGAAGLLIATPTSAAMLAWSTAGVQEFPDAVDLQVTGTAGRVRPGPLDAQRDPARSGTGAEDLAARCGRQPEGGSRRPVGSTVPRPDAAGGLPALLFARAPQRGRPAVPDAAPLPVADLDPRAGAGAAPVAPAVAPAVRRRQGPRVLPPAARARRPAARRAVGEPRARREPGRRQLLHRARRRGARRAWRWRVVDRRGLRRGRAGLLPDHGHGARQRTGLLRSRPRGRAAAS